MYILPEVVMQKILTHGLDKLRGNKEEFYDLFGQYLCKDLALDYGPKYLDDLWDWFVTTKLPVVQAWNLNVQRIPCLSVHLANEVEDESKAAIGDIFGDGEIGEDGIGVFTVMIDIGIHAAKAGDHVLWLYYIASYILFKHKRMAEKLGLTLHTFSASDYNKDNSKMTDNVWTRWIRFKCTTQNHFNMDKYLDIDEINIDEAVQLEESEHIAVSMDVDISKVDRTYNSGLQFEVMGQPEVDEEDGF